jgi:hypothetical protein
LLPLRSFINPQSAKAHPELSTLVSEDRPVKPKHVYWIGLSFAAVTSAAVAQYPAPGWHGPPGPGFGYLEPPGTHDPREGKIQVQTWLAKDPRTAGLGHGAVAVVAGQPTFAGPGVPAPVGPDSMSADGMFEAALAEQLAHAGYQLNGGKPEQTVEYVVTRELIQPPEPPHSPIHGEVGVGASNYGSGAGLGIMIDLSKPLGALVSTRVEARISDAATHQLLWQGQAELLARENDKHWRPEAIAGRLTTALFKNFPRPITG